MPVRILPQGYEGEHPEGYRARVARVHGRGERMSQEVTVWAVRYGNYYPMEINTLWATEALAQAQASKLGGAWCVEAMTVQEREDMEQGEGSPKD